MRFTLPFSSGLKTKGISRADLEWQPSKRMVRRACGFIGDTILRCNWMSPRESEGWWRRDLKMMHTVSLVTWLFSSKFTGRRYQQICHGQ